MKETETKSTRIYKRGQWTHAAIAKLMGISKCRVQQLEARALAKLRRSPIIRELAGECGILDELPSRLSG